MTAVLLEPGRWPAVADVCIWFRFDHLREGLPVETSSRFCDLAQQLVDTLPDSRELVKSLDNLLVAKDCAVRAALVVQEVIDAG